MNYKIISLILFTTLFSCTEKKVNSRNSSEVGRKNIQDEIAGSIYRKRAIGYFTITEKDTSKYMCIFSESKLGGKVSMDLNIPFYKNNMTYNERLNELRKILPEAAKDFNFDSLQYLDAGRLIESGDLAIDVMKQYKQKFNMTNRFESYSAVELFLKESKFGLDLDSLFKPYSISVSKVFIEKLFFTTKHDLIRASKLETDTTEIPNRILDCLISVELEKNKTPNR